MPAPTAGARPPLQDILQLLTLRLEYGGREAVSAAATHGLAVCGEELAHCRTAAARTQLPSPLGACAGHPQGLVYPLTVAATSPLHAQAAGVAHVLELMRRGRGVLVRQAALVASGLVRASCLKPQAWLESLEAASEVWFGASDSALCVRAILPLHAAHERGPRAPLEELILQLRGGPLAEARATLAHFEAIGEDMSCTARGGTISASAMPSATSSSAPHRPTYPLSLRGSSRRPTSSCCAGHV
jgi:FKBP12-rapamycin complex-associated protein